MYTGSSIDVYEWIESNLTPTVWNDQADTNDGLAQGISGQAKNTANYVEKQIYDPNKPVIYYQILLLGKR